MRFAFVILCLFATVSQAQTKVFSTDDSALKNFHMVEPGLYRSGSLTSKDISVLFKKYNIKTIVSLESYWLDSKSKREEKKAAKTFNIKWVNIPMNPVGDLDKIKVFKALESLKTEQRPLLFHCKRGSDRTGVVGGAYRILVNGWAFDAAVKEMDLYGFSPVFKEWKEDLYKWTKRQD